MFFFSVGITIILYPISSFPAVPLLSLHFTVFYGLTVGQCSDAFMWLHLLVGKDSTCLVIVHVSYSWVHCSFFEG